MSGSMSKSISSNTSSFNLLNKSRIRRKKQKEAGKTMVLLKVEKDRNDMFNSYIIEANYDIDVLIDKIKSLQKQIEQTQNGTKMNKTYSVNNPAMALISDSKTKQNINDLKTQIKDIQTQIKDIQTNISI